MSLYRAKTKEEFEKEFGSGWRYKINWPESMDCFLGKPIAAFAILKKDRWYIGSTFIRVSETVLIGDARYVVYNCGCRFGCSKCGGTGKIEKILENTNDPIKE